jgi:hypothetical protein
MPRGGIVTKTYRRIFGDDPLLLKEQSQLDYGRAMLEHILLHRPLTTSRPQAVDLHSNESRREFMEHANPSAPPPPDPDLEARYWEKRRLRERMDEADLKKLRNTTMVSDSTTTKSRIDNAFRNHQEIEGSLPPEQKEAFARRLRIAAVGYRVKVSRIPNQGHFQEELCFLPGIVDAPVPGITEYYCNSQLGRTHPLQYPERVRRWTNAVVSNINTALERKSQIVLLPEFGLPSPLTPPDERAHDASARGGQQSEVDEVVDAIKDASVRATRDHFLFAGTRHEERYNRGLIFSKRAGDVADEWWHYKAASARGLGENIMGPFGTKLPSYTTNIDFLTDEASITVAVCYDTYDPTMFLNLTLDGVFAVKDFIPRIILVPSFNPSDDFVELLRDLSFVARCTVIYVNGLHGDARMFVCGFALADFANHLGEVMESAKKRRVELVEEIRLESDDFAHKRVAERGVARTRAAGRKTSYKRKSLESLERLLLDLQEFESRRDLDNIITIEHCPKCASGGHTEDDLQCSRDILYYNIDVSLIRSLTRFRFGYFGNDDFLPEPFRWDRLDEARKQRERAQATREETDEPEAA